MPRGGPKHPAFSAVIGLGWLMIGGGGYYAFSRGKGPGAIRRGDQEGSLDRTFDRFKKDKDASSSD